MIEGDDDFLRHLSCVNKYMSDPASVATCCHCVPYEPPRYLAVQVAFRAARKYQKRLSCFRKRSLHFLYVACLE